MSLPLTLALMLGFAAFGAFAGWRGSLPPNLQKGPRMIPWRFLMLLSAMATLTLLVHVVNLLGGTTGRR